MTDQSPVADTCDECGGYVAWSDVNGEVLVSPCHVNDGAYTRLRAHLLNLRDGTQAELDAVPPPRDDGPATFDPVLLKSRIGTLTEVVELFDEATRRQTNTLTDNWKERNE